MSATFFGRLSLYFWCCSRGGIREAACWQHSECAQQIFPCTNSAACYECGRDVCWQRRECAQQAPTAYWEKCLVSLSWWQHRGCAQQQRPAELYAMVPAVMCAGSAENVHSHRRAEDFARCWQHSECAQRRQMWGGIFGRKIFKSTVSGWDFLNFNSGKIRTLSDFHSR